MHFKKCKTGFKKKLSAKTIVELQEYNGYISSKILNRGGSNKIKNFPKSKISQIEVQQFGNVSQNIPVINYDGSP